MTQLADGKRRICVICDGMEGLLRMASYLADLPADISRTDLDMSAAHEALLLAAHDPWDQIVIAADILAGVQPRALEAVIAAALTAGREVIWLLSPEQAIPQSLDQRVRLMRGPPFEPVERASPVPPSSSIPARSNLLRRLLSRQALVVPTAEQSFDPQISGPLSAKNVSVLAIQSAVGGGGSSTLATNLGVLFAQAEVRVCLLDLNLQFGALASYLGLSASEAVVDIYRRLERLDLDLFQSGLQAYGRNLHLFSAPADVLPMDGLSSTQLYRLLDLARQVADIVIVDLPQIITDWSASMYRAADLVFAVGVREVRSADNLRKLRQLLVSEDVDCAHFSYLLNRTQTRQTSFDRAEELALVEGLGQTFLARLSEGGDEMRRAANEGVPISVFAPKNPYVRDVKRLVEQLLPQIPRLDMSPEGETRRYV